MLALFVGFHFSWKPPLGGVNGGDCRGWAGIRGRWGALLWGDPLSRDAAYHRTFIGCIAALTIIILMIRTPLLMVLVCCIWAGFCTPGLSLSGEGRKLLRTGLAGYTRTDYCHHHSKAEPLLARSLPWNAAVRS